MMPPKNWKNWNRWLPTNFSTPWFGNFHFSTFPILILWTWVGRRKGQFTRRFNKSTKVFCTLINLRNDVRMIKANKPPQNYCRFFFNNIDSFDVHFRRSFPENRAFGKEKSKLRHHHVISIVCTLIKHSSRPIKARNRSVIEKNCLRLVLDC